jgi:hypothetical protein
MEGRKDKERKVSVSKPLAPPLPQQKMLFVLACKADASHRVDGVH